MVAILNTERLARLTPREITIAYEREVCRNSFRAFVSSAWPQVEAHRFRNNWHISAVADHLQAVSEGEIRNLMINVPPRSTKSVLVAVMWQAWEWTWNPMSQWLFSSYAADLAQRDAGKCLWLIYTSWYQERWGDQFSLVKDPVSRYFNDRRGYRVTTSVGSKTTGEGGDRLVVDDPHNTRDVYSDAKRRAVLDWWDLAMSNRLNDPKRGSRVLVGQRSHDNDLFGHIIDQGLDYVHLDIPMEYVSSKAKSTVLFSDPRSHDGELMDPRRFGPAEVRAEKKTKTERDYQAQYQQQPTGAKGLIIKRSWWRRWPLDQPPVCIAVIQFGDTAFSEDEEADYSARTTWGLFVRRERYDEKHGTYIRSEDPADESIHCILLEGWQERVGYPELRAEFIAGVEKFDPDKLFVENRASGQSLIQDMRQARTKSGRRIPIRSVEKTVDKVTAAHFASITPEKGRVWYMDRAWAQVVIDQTVKFPMAENDDLADTCFMAWAYMRRRNDIRFADEEGEDDSSDLFAGPRRSIYG